MNKVMSFKGFLVYSLDVFWPLLILWIPIIFIFGFGSITRLITGFGSGDWSDIILAFYGIGIAIFPILLLLSAYLINHSLNVLWTKGLVIYFFWCLAVIIPLYFLSAGLGGMVDGYVKNHQVVERHLNYLSNALLGTLFAQPIIIVLTAFGIYKLKKIEK